MELSRGQGEAIVRLGDPEGVLCRAMAELKEKGAPKQARYQTGNVSEGWPQTQSLLGDPEGGLGIEENRKTRSSGSSFPNFTTERG